MLEVTHQDHSIGITLLLLVRATYIYSFVLHAHPVRGESHNQRNTTGEVATVQIHAKGYQVGLPVLYTDF